MGLFQFVVFGLETGALIAVAAMGFTLIYGIVNMINFAYGEYVTIGAYVAWASVAVGGLGIWSSLLVATVATAVLGWVVSRVFFVPLHEQGPIPLLLTSIGLGFLLRNAFAFFFDVDRRFVDVGAAYGAVPATTFRFDLPAVTVAGVDLLGDFFVTTNMLVTMALAVVLLGGLHGLLTRTDLGIAMRATASNESLAELSGVPAYTVRQYTWVIASALAGVGGVLLLTRESASPVVGFDQILFVLAAAILGGAGSIYGAVVGAVVIGLSREIVAGLGVPVLSDVPVSVAFLVLVVILLVRPEGIAGEEVSS
ncbi:branched-chain amino acid ABC transporter permease [Halobaculum sp. MBLA0147]|uniref:branched-chain amino acid ABC transporter permease n=1 Tax=Halobaculum sp. MBLA0147 TaxID=3079934 RepID=UPI00352372B8